MLRAVLLPFEGSDADFAAADLAIDWAQRWNPEVAVVGVVDETIGGPAAVPLGGGEYKQQRDQDLTERDRQTIQSGVYQIQTRFERAGLRHRTAVRPGVPHREIVDEAAAYDLVMMGRQTKIDIGVGESPRQTLREVLRASPRPVVAVPENYRKAAGVLIAYNGSLQAARSLFALQATGLTGLGDVHVLCVDSKSEAAAAERAGRAVDYLRFHEVQAVPLAVKSDTDPGAVILGEADRLGVGLIAMGAYGRSTLMEFLVGSVTSTLLNDSSRPLFIFH
jgi:nucleotide-binding universal stress UspA family protein